MPGLVNTHAHTPMTLVRRAGDGLPLERWLREAVWPREAGLTDDDVRWGMLLGATSCSGRGVTTTCEMYLHGRDGGRGGPRGGDPLRADPGGLRACRARRGLAARPGGGRGGPRRLRRAAADWSRSGVGPHAAYMLPAEGLVAVAALAGRARGARPDPRGRDRGRGAGRARRPTAAARRAPRAARAARPPGAGRPLGVARPTPTSTATPPTTWPWPTAPESNAKLGSGVARLAEMLARGSPWGWGPTARPPTTPSTCGRSCGMAAAPGPGRRGRRRRRCTTAEALWLATRGRGRGPRAGHRQSSRPVGPADFVRVELADSALRARPATTASSSPTWCGRPAAGWSPTSGWAAARWSPAGSTTVTTVDADEAPPGQVGPTGPARLGRAAGRPSAGGR